MCDRQKHKSIAGIGLAGNSRPELKGLGPKKNIGQLLGGRERGREGGYQIQILSTTEILKHVVIKNIGQAV